MGTENRGNEAVQIHPTAIVDPTAEIGVGTQIGAFSIIGKHVKIGDRSTIHDHVVIQQRTRLGEACQVFPFSVLGGPPQHVRYQGEPTELEIGDRVLIRESVTIHRGTEFGNFVTKVGNDTFLMAYAHVAHDCVIGKKVIVCNAVQMAGHVTLEDYSYFGGHGAIAQFCRVGRYCYVGGGSILRQDLPPFMAGKGGDFQVQGINAVGLSRQGFQKSVIMGLKNLYKIFYLQNLKVKEAIDKIQTSLGQTDEVKVFIDFVNGSKVGFTR